MKDLIIERLLMLPMVLNLFDANPNTQVTTANTTGNDLSPEMKTYYSDYLIDLMEAELIHDRFGQQAPIPKNGGKTIEFRRYDSLPELTTPLTEGVTPDGQNLNVSVITATVKQYGGYVTLSDMLIMTAIDNNVIQATKLIASQAGRTMDGTTRDVLNAGTVVRYCGGKTTRAALTPVDGECNITVDDVRKAVRDLEAQDAPRINGYYIGIIHPSVKYDLMSDLKWEEPHTYADTTEIYENEIGRLYGVRFIENTRAKVFKNAGANNADVYSTLIFGRDAYGVTPISGNGVEHIVKQLGSGGSNDPLNQRATVGWKGVKAAEILVEQYMVRVESTASD